MSRTYARHDRRRRPAEERRAVRVARTLDRIAAMEAAASPLAGNR
jgi:hypothetical protein